MPATKFAKLGSMLDDLVEAFSPERGLRRKSMRLLAKRAHKLSAYQGAEKSRRQNWITSGGSADADLDEDTLESLRERSRDRCRNDALASAALGSLTDNVVGTGFRPVLDLPWRELGITEAKARILRDQATMIWREWSPVADSCNRLSIDEIQHLVLASTLLNGDAFVVPILVQDARVASRFELKLELIEGDRVATPVGLDSDRVRSGVELGARGQPVGYWVSQAHPGDQFAFRPGSRKFRRVAAHGLSGRPNILHVYHQDRIGQSRGRPYLSTVLTLFKDRDDYMEAELIAAQVSACFAAFVKRIDPLGSMLSRATSDTKGAANREEELSPGAIMYLGAGEDVTFGNPSRPSSQFGAFLASVSRAITSALGMPYEVATRDFSGTTYSQARASLLEARRMFVRRQRWFVGKLLQPVWQMLLEEAWLKGIFEAGADFGQRLPLWTRTHWVPPGWGWIDPQKEVVAWREALEMGVTTRSKIVASIDGDDFEGLSRQLSEEQQLREELGLAGSNAPQATEPPDDDGTQEPEAESEDDDEETESEPEAEEAEVEEVAP